jgi:hypothetical protein
VSYVARLDVALILIHLSRSEYCETATPTSWAYNQTVNHCLDHAQKLYHDGMAEAQDSETRIVHLTKAVEHFGSAIGLMHAHLQYWDSCSSARKHLGEHLHPAQQ